MKIGAINNQLFSQNNLNINNRQDKYQKYLDKYNYLEAKTKDYQDLSLVLLIASFFLGVHNIDFAKQLNFKQKLSCVTMLGSIGSFIATCIKKQQLSKEYDLENKL